MNVIIVMILFIMNIQLQMDQIKQYVFKVVHNMIQIVMHLIQIIINVKYVQMDIQKIMKINVKNQKCHIVKMDKVILKQIQNKEIIDQHFIEVLKVVNNVIMVSYNYIEILQMIIHVYIVHMQELMYLKLQIQNIQLIVEDIMKKVVNQYVIHV